MNPHTTSATNTTTSPAKAASPSSPLLDTDLGSCGRAGRQQPLASLFEVGTRTDSITVDSSVAGTMRPATIAVSPSGTDLFGRPLDRRQRALADGLTARKRNWVAWPVIGAGCNLPDGRTFNWLPYSADFRSGTSVTVYASVCDGICDLGKLARLSLAKLGISTRPDLTVRMAEANADRYASLHEKDGKIVDEAGYESWEPLRLPPQEGPSYPSPVERLPRGLLVSLPVSMTVESFDAAFTALLDPCRLDRWIDTPDGERHCARLEVDPRRLRRFTAHVNADGAIRLKQTSELYVFRRREDTDRLVTAVEGLIAKHLLTQKAEIADSALTPDRGVAPDLSVREIAARLEMAAAATASGGRS